MQKFTSKVFFPYLKKHKIKTCIHLGDLVDRRKYISFKTAKYLRQDFLEPLQQQGIITHIIMGNHDTSYRAHHEVNALHELVDGKYNNIKIYDNPTEVIFDEKKMLFIPWICDSNYTKTMELLNESNAQIVMGHLELSGFEMHRGNISHSGINRDAFNRFNIVCSGHYHHKSSNGNINYIGSMSEHTWSDYNDPRGFHIFDTETLKLEFIPNPYIMFKKIWYDDSKGNDPLDFKPKEYKDTIVKVVISNKENPYLYDTFISKLEDSGTIDVIPVDDHLNLDVGEEEVNENQDTLSIFTSYVEAMDVQGVNKETLRASLIEIYNQALELQ